MKIKDFNFFNYPGDPYCLRAPAVYTPSNLKKQTCYYLIYFIYMGLTKSVRVTYSSNIDPPLGEYYHKFLLPKASRAVSRMLTGLNGKSISFCTDKQGPICYQLSMCVVDPQMTYFVSQTEINQANRLKVDHSQRGKRAIARR